MYEKKKGHLESSRVLRNIRTGLSECMIQIDFSEYIIFYDPTELLAYINKDVTYVTRPDIVNGKEVEVICELALLTEVVTVDAKKTDIKLVPFDLKRPICNFNIREVKFGEYKVDCIAILTKLTLGESRKAKWLDCQMLDAYGHLFDLRVFITGTDQDTIDKYNVMVNGYVEFDMESTKYGFQSNEVKAINQEIEASPEIAVAKKVVLDHIAKDSVLQQVVTAVGFERGIDEYVDGEPGYLWVRMASEYYFIDALDNTTSGVNITSLYRAIVCSRMYALPHSNPWSHGIINVTKLVKFKELMSDEELRQILDVYYEKDPSDAKNLYYRIRALVDNIIDTRRGIINEENYRKNLEFISNCRSMFNGLL